MWRRIRGSRAPILYVAADLAALLVFVIVGLRGHRVANLDGFVRNAVPLLGAWLLVAWPLRTYRRPGWRTLLKTWIVAVPVGLLVRTAIVGSPRGARILVFVGIGLASTLVALVLARLFAGWIRRAR
jgi:hypothetical protein